MIYIVTAENRDLFQADLSAMHRHRKHTFVDTLGWHLPTRADQEIDTYDGPHTIYLIARPHPTAAVAASARLLPTTGSHLMGDLFPHICTDGAPRGDALWEASRFCPAPPTPRRERLALLWQIFCGIMETALLYDIERVIFTANHALRPLALECGWRARALGPTVADGSDSITAIAVDIDRAGLRTLRQRFRIASPITRFVSPVRLAA